MEKLEAYDALGNKIVIGGLYGASRNSNGHTTATVGRVVKITKPGKVTLEVVTHKTAIFEHRVEETSMDRKKVNYLSSALFPVEEYKILK